MVIYESFCTPRVYECFDWKINNTSIRFTRFTVVFLFTAFITHCVPRGALSSGLIFESTEVAALGTIIYNVVALI